MSSLLPGKVVAVLAPLFPPAFRGGGPIRSIEALVDSASAAHRVKVLTSDRDLGVVETLPVECNKWVHLSKCDVIYSSIQSPRLLLSAMRAVRQTRPDLIHLNSFFHPTLGILPALLWRVGFWGNATLVISPRGEFGNAALGRRSAKKRVYLAVFRLLGLQKLVVWHATAAHELTALRSLWGRGAMIVERSNDTMLPRKPLKVRREADAPVRFVFLSRIVEHKGLFIALEALHRTRLEVQLDIYGAREDARYVERCEQSAASLPPNVKYTFHDAVDPRDVRATLARSDVMILPTAGENFGHIIAEALSSSCIVVASDSTPWTDVLNGGAGAVVAEREPEAWGAALEGIARLEHPALLEWRERAGAAYAEWASRPTAPHLWEVIFEEKAKLASQSANIWPD